ncbi:hypothetical protein [Nocardia amamiensis]|uniref:hypothetical protein n=1 Tax=Nocardia amamiensis TaxID=404578 RepID=UPI000832B0CB|nr:hypothetical protein [Nocardia amamiensis]
MAEFTITLDDRLAALVQAEAAGDVSAWIAKACTSRLLRQEAEALAAWQRAHPAETAAQYAEAEAEREFVDELERLHAEHGELTAEKIADTERRVRALLEREQ